MHRLRLDERRHQHLPPFAERRTRRHFPSLIDHHLVSLWLLLSLDDASITLQICLSASDPHKLDHRQTRIGRGTCTRDELLSRKTTGNTQDVTQTMDGFGICILSFFLPTCAKKKKKHTDPKTECPLREDEGEVAGDSITNDVTERRREERGKRRKFTHMEYILSQSSEF